MKIKTDIAINASPSRVWQILMDFEKYPEWNPLIKEIKGQIKLDSRLEVLIKLPNRHPIKFKPKVYGFKPEQEFRWLGGLGGIYFLFTGEHYFVLEPRGQNQTRLVQAERFSGLLVPFFKKYLADIQKGFEAMNQALKVRAEQ